MSFLESLSKSNIDDTDPLTIQPIKDGFYKAQITDLKPYVLAKNGETEMMEVTLQFTEPVYRRAPLGKTKGEVLLDAKHTEKVFIFLSLNDNGRKSYEDKGENPEEAHLKSVIKSVRRIIASAYNEEKSTVAKEWMVKGKLAENLVGKAVFTEVKITEKNGNTYTNIFFVEKFLYEAKKAR